MRPTDTAKVLASRADEVARLLLPNGKSVGPDWCVGSTSGEPGQSLKVRISGDKKGVWLDFASGGSEHGDLIGLWKAVRGLDLDQANIEALEWLGIPDDKPEDRVSDRIETKAPSETWKRIQSKMRKGTQSDMQALAALRNIPATAPLELASQAGQLWFADVWDKDGFEYPAWIITDDDRRNAQARRMDGKPWTEQGKCKTIHGTSSKWPIGLNGVNGHDIAFVEGSPDLLAAWYCIWIRGLQDKIFPVAVFGGSVSIPEEIFPVFAGKQVFLFPHNDKAGKDAGEKWSSQLRKAKAAAVVSFDLKPKIGKDLNDLISEETSWEDETPEIFNKMFVGPKRVGARSITSYAYPSDDDPNILIGKDDYLGRGGGMLFVSHAGAGKSSWIMDACMMWGLGRPWMGLKCSKPLRSLIIQAEDSDRYIGKISASFKHKNKLGDKECAQLGENCMIVRLKGVSGPAFFQELKRLTELHQPDIVVVNPIYLYAEGDIGRSEFAQPFLLGLDQVNNEEKFAYILIHHTGKPTAKGKDGKRAEVEDWESAYMGFGSSYLANWPRCTALLEPIAGESGKFMIKLGKGGFNAGLTREVPQGAGVRLEPCTRIAIRHSTEKMEIGGRERPVFYWEQDELVESAPQIKTGRPTKYQFSDYLHIFPKAGEPGKTRAQLWNYAKDFSGIKDTAFRDLLLEAAKAGKLTRTMTTSGFTYAMAGSIQPSFLAESD